jgi:hypothetical protein
VTETNSQAECLLSDLDTARDFLSTFFVEKIQFTPCNKLAKETKNTVGELLVPCSGEIVKVENNSENDSIEIKKLAICSNLAKKTKKTVDVLSVSCIEKFSVVHKSINDSFKPKHIIDIPDEIASAEKIGHKGINIGYFIMQIREDMFANFYVDQRMVLNITKFNSKGKLVKYYDPFYRNKFTFFHTVKYSPSNDVFILFTTIKSHPLDKGLERFIYVLDAETLSIKRESSAVPQRLDFICLNKEYIFMRLKRESKTHLVIMNMKLNILKRIDAALIRPTSIFDDPHLLTMFATNDFFFIVYNDFENEQHFNFIQCNHLIRDGVTCNSSKTISLSHFIGHQFLRFKLDLNSVFQSGFLTAFDFDRHVFKFYKTTEDRVYFEKRAELRETRSNFLLVENNPFGNLLILNTKTKKLILFNVKSI